MMLIAVCFFVLFPGGSGAVKRLVLLAPTRCRCWVVSVSEICFLSVLSLLLSFLVCDQ